MRKANAPPTGNKNSVSGPLFLHRFVKDSHISDRFERGKVGNLASYRYR